MVTCSATSRCVGSSPASTAAVSDVSSWRAVSRKAATSGEESMGSRTCGEKVGEGVGK